MNGKAPWRAEGTGQCLLPHSRAHAGWKQQPPGGAEP